MRWKRGRNIFSILHGRNADLLAIFSVMIRNGEGITFLGILQRIVARYF